MQMTLVVPISVFAPEVENDVMAVAKYEEFLKTKSYKGFQKNVNLTENEKQQVELEKKSQHLLNWWKKQKHNNMVVLIAAGTYSI